MSGQGRLAAAVALGSALGSLVRAATYLGLENLPAAWPWASTLVNACGSLLIGLFAGYAAVHPRWRGSPALRQGVLVGFCGGYTTFSVFSLDTFEYLHAGLYAAALTYALVSVLLWLAAVWLGSRLAIRLTGDR